MENINSENEIIVDSEKQNLINTTQLVSRALGMILEELEGIVVDVLGDVKFEEEIQKVLIYKYKNEIHITKCLEDLVDGTTIKLIFENESEN